ncbi:runt-related transcription factor 3-like isoform X1 [Lates japonicus]|uniref:Runt-related transcription factor 3-like isoform X1 n=1 Tax=Lates japonicus TaxID=270547 RepID=A0AAD3ML97_LATJO|nr:runt-related transcription factor 3-like isoform X1 [Lates japonicus]
MVSVSLSDRRKERGSVDTTEDHKPSPPRRPTSTTQVLLGGPPLISSPGRWRLTAARAPRCSGFPVMASNSIFDSFSNYSSSLLRGLMEWRHNGILTTDIHYQVKLCALSVRIRARGSM